MSLRYVTLTERETAEVFPRFLPVGSIAPANYRIFVVLNHCALLGLLVHVLLIPIFAWLGVIPMAWFNVVSAVVWGEVLLANRQGHHNFAIFSSLIEVTVHSALAIVYIGWGSGFQYYLLLASPLFFFTPLLGTLKKALTLGGVILIFVALQIYSDHYPPLVTIKHSIVTSMFYVNIITVFVVQAALSHYYHFIATEAEERLRDANEQLATIAGTDFLTGLINRRQLLDELDAGRRDAMQPLTLVMADIDKFKQINDRFGHECGDRILCATAEVMGRHVRKQDMLARWGGEEFLLVLPRTVYTEAGAVADKIRRYVALTEFEADGQPLQVTMSFGIADCRPGEGLMESIARADAAMYRAKAAGRNCVAVAEDEPATGQTSGGEADIA